MTTGGVEGMRPDQSRGGGEVLYYIKQCFYHVAVLYKSLPYNTY